MGRMKRISFPGALFHITVRGNNKEKIFVDNRDYQRYLKILKRYKEELVFRLYAYVLMPNHTHLLIQVGEKADISKIMQSINTAYTKFFVIKYKRVGHLFQGRFRSTLVDKDEYLFTLTLYIHLNPVRAKLVKCPEDYRWSSCKSYFTGNGNSLVDVDEALSLLGTSPEEQRRMYKKLTELESVQKGKQVYLKEKIKNSKGVLGSDDFIKRLYSTSGTK